MWVSRRGTWGGSAWPVCEKGGAGCPPHGASRLGVPVSFVRGGVVAHGPSFGHGESGWIQGSPVQLNHVAGGASKQQEANTEWCVRSGGRIALYVDDKFVSLKSKRFQWKMIE